MFILTFENLFASSLAKCVEVRLFDNENKGSNFFTYDFENHFFEINARALWRGLGELEVAGERMCLHDQKTSRGLRCPEKNENHRDCMHFPHSV